MSRVTIRTILPAGDPDEIAERLSIMARSMGVDVHGIATGCVGGGTLVELTVPICHEAAASAALRMLA